MLGEFEFDCPNRYFELSMPFSTVHMEDHVVDEWFLTAHESHEKDYVENSLVSVSDGLRSGAKRELTSSAKRVRIESNQNQQAFNSSDCVQSSGGSIKSRRSTSSTLSRRRSSSCSLEAHEEGENESVEDNILLSVNEETSAVCKPAANSQTDAPIKRKIVPMKGSNLAVSGAARAKPQTAPAVTNRTYNSNGTISVPSRYLQSAASKASVPAPVTSKPTRSVLSSTAGGAANRPAPLVRTTSAGTISNSNSSSNAPARRPLSSRSVGSTKTSSVNTIKSAKAEEDAETALLASLLKKHNERFAPIPAYEPPRHSVREVRQWEKISGVTWNSLKPEEREKANSEIARLKAEGAIVTK